MFTNSNPETHRAYFFGNMYISPIQHGIQAAHVVTRMAANTVVSGATTHSRKMFFNWATYGVTKILLNGGYQSNLIDIAEIFHKAGHALSLPNASFREEHDALNGAMTSVGIVVPYEVYNHTDTPENISDFIVAYFPEVIGTNGSFVPSVKELLAVVRECVLSESDWCKVLYYTLKTGRLA